MYDHDHYGTVRGDLVITPIFHASVVMQWDGNTIFLDPVGLISRTRSDRRYTPPWRSPGPGHLGRRLCAYHRMRCATHRLRSDAHRLGKADPDHEKRR